MPLAVLFVENRWPWLQLLCRWIGTSHWWNAWGYGTKGTTWSTGKEVGVIVIWYIERFSFCSFWRSYPRLVIWRLINWMDLNLAKIMCKSTTRVFTLCLPRSLNERLHLHLRGSRPTSWISFWSMDLNACWWQRIEYVFISCILAAFKCVTWFIALYRAIHPPTCIRISRRAFNFSTPK